MSDAATQLILAFSALPPSERHAVMLELAKIPESETELSDEGLGGMLICTPAEFLGGN